MSQPPPPDPAAAAPEPAVSPPLPPEPNPLSTRRPLSGRPKYPNYQAKNGLDRIPRPLGVSFYELPYVAVFIGRPLRAVYDILHRYADRFDPPMYQRLPGNTRRLCRIISEH